MRPRTPAIARRAHGGCCRRCVTRKRQWALGGPLRRLRSVLSDCARRRLRGTVRVGGDRRASKYDALPLRLHRFILPVFVVVVVDDERLSGAQRSLTAAWRARSTVVTAKTVAIRAPQRPGQLPVGRPSWQRNWAPDTAIPPPDSCRSRATNGYAELEASPAVKSRCELYLSRTPFNRRSSGRTTAPPSTLRWSRAPGDGQPPQDRLHAALLAAKRSHQTSDR